MPSPHQRFPDSTQRLAHAFLDRQALDFIPTLPVLATAVCESQKVEGLRLTQPSLFPLSRSKASEDNQPRFLWMQLQAEAG